MRTTLKKLQNLCDEINKVSKIQYKLARRNGYTYFEETETHNTHGDCALTNKELYCYMYGFWNGLTD